MPKLSLRSHCTPEEALADAFYIQEQLKELFLNVKSSNDLTHIHGSLYIGICKYPTSRLHILQSRPFFLIKFLPILSPTVKEIFLYSSS